MMPFVTRAAQNYHKWVIFNLWQPDFDLPLFEIRFVGLKGGSTTRGSR